MNPNVDMNSLIEVSEEADIEMGEGWRNASGQDKKLFY